MKRVRIINKLTFSKSAIIELSKFQENEIIGGTAQSEDIPWPKTGCLCNTLTINTMTK